MSFVRSRPFILFALLLVIYSPVLLTQSPVDPDSQIIIPHLTSIDGIGDYLSRMFSLQTIDVQPVRDVSLFVDVLIFNLTGWNSLVGINLLLWFGAALVIFRILKKLFPEIEEKKLAILVAAFAVYPLFTQTIAWGMARKHVLSFFFIMLATYYWIHERKISILFYGLSIFSQPITVLWPLWGYFFRPNLKKVIPLFGLMIATIIINFCYYKHSPTMLATYGSKINEASNVPEMLLALGHYFFQLLFPYLLSSTYELGHWSSLAGLFLSVLFVAIVFKKGQKNRVILSFLLLSVLPILIVLSKPSFIYDTYLLLPAFALLVVVLGTWKEHFLKVPMPALLILISFWCALSFFETGRWTDEVKLTQTSFNRRPGCKAAFQHLRSSYENGSRPEASARIYLQDHDCSGLAVSPQHAINLAASMAYYEEEKTIEERLSLLRKISVKGIYPHLALAAFYIKLNQENKATQTLHEIAERWGNIRFKNEYIPLTDQVLKPFCEKTSNKECLETLKPFTSKTRGLAYR